MNPLVINILNSGNDDDNIYSAFYFIRAFGLPISNLLGVVVMSSLSRVGWGVPSVFSVSFEISDKHPRNGTEDLLSLFYGPKQGTS